MTRQTDDLINILSATTPHKKAMPFGYAFLALTLVSLAATFIMLGTLRPDLMALQPPPEFFAKTSLLAGLALTAFFYLRQAAKPLPAFPSFAFALIVPGILAGLVGWEFATASSPENVLSVVYLPNFLACLWFVTLYGLAGTAALTALMRHYAPADEKTAAGLIGFGAAAACAVGYSFHCPIDSPTFIALAYGLPVLGLTLLARLFVPYFIRW